ncbi:MAG: dTDP-glucose 4,6-dehydratase [Pseudomonadales bacterium]|nr:dTDP-glucose 4,6-dehydratase [Pseudomonadales bacterium]
MANILVTGGAGFIGTNFVYYWVNKYPNDNLVVLDSLSYAANIDNLTSLINDKQITFVRGSICNQELVATTLQEFNIDTLINFAAESHVDRSISNPDAFIETNILGTYSLLKAAKNIWLDSAHEIKHRFHHISTDEVFGSLGPDEPAFHEKSQYQPNSPYSASKASSDHLVRAYHHTYGLNVTTSNCSNNYGPFHFPEKLIPLCITNLLKGQSLPIYGDGKNIRDWLHVEDHCNGIDLIVKNGTPGKSYNIGGENEWDNLSLVQLVCEEMDAEFKTNPELKQEYPNCPAAKTKRCEELITFVKDRAGHDRRYAIDSTLISSELGFSPTLDLNTGLRKTIKWYTKNPSWWQKTSFKL